MKNDSDDNTLEQMKLDSDFIFSSGGATYDGTTFGTVPGDLDDTKVQAMRSGTIMFRDNMDLEDIAKKKAGNPIENIMEAAGEHTWEQADIDSAIGILAAIKAQASPSANM